MIFDLPPVNSPEDAAKIASAVLIAVATGELTPADASEICKVDRHLGEGFRDGRAGGKDDEPMIRGLESRISRLEQWIATYGPKADEHA